jgi:hypothetical protein
MVDFCPFDRWILKAGKRVNVYAIWRERKFVERVKNHPSIIYPACKPDVNRYLGERVFNSCFLIV